MARIWRSLIVLGAFGAGALSPTVVRPAAAAAAGPPVFLLGDSVMAGLRYGNAVDIIAERSPAGSRPEHGVQLLRHGRRLRGGPV